MTFSQKRMLAGGIGILLVAQILYCLFTLATVYKTYRSSILSVHSVATEKLGLDLSRLVRFGKNIERMEELPLQLHTVHQSTNLDYLVIRNATGQDFAAYPKGFVAPALPTKNNELKTIRSDVKEFSAQGIIWLSHPVRNRAGDTVGTVLTGIDEGTVRHTIIGLAAEQGLFFGGITLLGCALLLLLLLCEGKAACPKLGKWCFIIPLVVSQILFLGYLYAPVSAFLQERAFQTATQLGKYIEQDIQHIVSLGLPLQDVPSIKEYLDGVRKNLPWVQSLLVQTAGSYTSGQAENVITASTPLIAGSGKTVGTIVVGVADSFINTAYMDIVLNTLTTMVIALLFMLELLSLQNIRANSDQYPVGQGGQAQLSPLYVRPLLFLCMFAIDLPISFIPLRIAEMDLTLFGLPADVVMGLPLSVEMCTVGLGIMLGGLWSQKRGWRPLFIWGAVLVTVGNMASGMAVTSLSYIFARAFSGFGYGLINMAGQIFVVSHTNQENRAANISAMVAGLYAGFLCGSAFGGLIADTVGYSYAFFASSLCMAGIGVFLFCMPREPWQPEASQGSGFSFKAFGALLADKKMLGLLLGNIFPCAFVTVCLFQFFIPVSLHNGGVSPAGIGRVFLVFCLLIIYFGPVIGKIVDASHNKLPWLLAGGMLCIGGIGALWVFEGLPAAFLSVALLALCNAIIPSAQGAYALELPISHTIGSANTVSCYNITERIGQMLGPVTLGQVIAVWGVSSGLLGMAAVLIVLNLFFALMGWSSAKGTE
ncbi:MAG: MFS transporter [Desulfovibrionaceae bacterium]|nr:MFS transporter [Desulfovibrionaceae bacterium]